MITYYLSIGGNAVSKRMTNDDGSSVHQTIIEDPDNTDYLDGMVKGDQAQIDKYIADCQAVKAKYPKG